MRFFLIASFFLALQFYVYTFFAKNEVTPPRDEFILFPKNLGSWICNKPYRMDAASEKNLGITDYFMCDFYSTEFDQQASIYLGYHKTQTRDGSSQARSIHTPKHCLPGAGWNIIDMEEIEIPWKTKLTQEPRINRLVIANGERRAVAYYWYHSRGRIIAEDWKKALFLTWDRARLHRTDGSLIRVTVPMAQENNPDDAFLDIASQFFPILDQYIPD